MSPIPGLRAGAGGGASNSAIDRETRWVIGMDHRVAGPYFTPGGWRVPPLRRLLASHGHGG